MEFSWMNRELLEAALRVLRTVYSGNQPSLADISLLRKEALPWERELDLPVLARKIIWREIGDVSPPAKGAAG